MSEQKFKVGDFVYPIVSKPRVIYKVKEAGAGKDVRLIRADGYEETFEFLYNPEELKLFNKSPKFKIGDKIKNPITQNGSGLGGSAKTLIEKSNNENLGYLVVTDVTYNRYEDGEFSYWLGFLDLPNASVSFNDEDNLELFKDPFEQKFKVGQIVKVKGRPEKYTISGKSIIADDGLQIYEGTDMETGMLFPLFENTLELYEETPEKRELKFKIGDKVKIPKTRWGTPIEDFDFTFIETAKKNNQDYLYVVDITLNADGTDIYKVWLTDTPKGEDDVSFKMTDNIELYEETPDKPEPKFKVGDQVIYYKMPFNSFTVDKITNFNQKRKTWIYKLSNNNKKGSWSAGYEDEMRLIDADTPEIEETPDKPKPKFKVGDIVKSIDGKQFRQYEVLKVEFGVDEYVYDVKRVGTEAYVVYTESELELISRATTDCEADPSLIVSGQVKKFYDLNKLRIEKLKSEFSCKIIKALVSLSDYEKCGTPSKIKLPSSKEDLLSKIQNLKF